MSEAENIPLWNNEQVLEWFKGLNESLQVYRHNIAVAEVTGAQLIALNYEDLNNLYIESIGHQELLLEATALLRKLNYEIHSENLQSHALELHTCCKALRSEIVASQRELDVHALSLQNGTPKPWLRLAADVLDGSKTLVTWLDRPPFMNRSNFKQIRNAIVRLSVEMSVTMQQNVFVCVIQDATLNICKEIETATDRIIQSNDVLTIQPASLEQVNLVNSEAGLGLFIKSTFDGHHVISGTKEGSISSKIRRIVQGDEVVSVNGQTVIGWQLMNLVNKLKENVHEVSLVLKKRPYVTQTSLPTLPLQVKPRLKRYAKAPPSISPLNQSALEHLKVSANRESVKRRSYSDSFNDNKLEKRLTKHHHTNSTSSTSVNRIVNDAQSSTQRLSIRNDHQQSTVQSSGTETTQAKPDEVKGRINREYLSLNSDATIPTRSNKKKEAAEEEEEAQTKPEDHASKSSHAYMSLTHSKPDDAAKNMPLKHDSALDLFVLPPPPEEPYSPRQEHALPDLSNLDHRNSFDISALPPPTGSESPNSLMDIEHKRRFTVIGAENFDDKWYDEFIAKINKHIVMTSDTRDSSDDNVFESNQRNKSVTTTTDDHIREQVVHPHSASRRHNYHANRPVSMPPNYYSDSQLQQYRVGHSSGSCHTNNRVLTTIPDESLLPSDEQQKHNRRKTKPVKPKRLSSFNSNNSNNNQSKPPPRASSVDELNNYDVINQHNDVRRSLAEFVKEKRFSQSSSNQQPASNMEANAALIPERKYHTPERPLNSTDLSKVKPRTKLTRSLSLRSDTPPGDRVKLDYVSDIPSPTRVKSPPRLATPVKVPLKDENLVAHPHAKPRSKSAVNISKKQLTPTIVISPVESAQIRSKSMENLEPVKYRTPPKQKKKKTAVEELKASPNSMRSSYGAAIEGGYSPPESKKSKWKMKKDPKSSSGSSLSSSSNVPQEPNAYKVKIVNGVPVRIRKSGNTNISSDDKKSQSTKNKVELLKYSEMPSSRRISCKDLGDGECHGWLWKKKIATNSRLASKWSKRWLVLKRDGLYCYRTPDDGKAESYIEVYGYEIKPAPECKRSFAFRCSHEKRKTFFFASENQHDMGRWMNKLGLAAIGYKDKHQYRSGSPILSESENEDSLLSSPTSSNRSSVADSNNVSKSSPEKTYVPHASKGYSFNTKAITDQKKLEAKMRFQSENRQRPTPAKRSSLDSSKIHKVEVNENIKTATPADKKLKQKSKSVESLSKHRGANFISNLESIEKAKLTASKKETQTPLKKSQSSVTTTTKSALKHKNYNLREALVAKDDIATKSNTASPKSLERLSLDTSPNSQLARVMQGQQPEDNKETNTKDHEEATDRSSIIDLSKSLQNAEVDINGISRRVTLRRKMTVLSHDPPRNRLLLKQRSLKRQLKALQIDLEYFNDLLDRPKITSDLLNDWLNRHQSLYADINSIRRLSQKRKNKNSNKFVPEDESEKGSSDESGDKQSGDVNIGIQSQETNNNTIKEIQETSFVGDDIETNFKSNSPKVRPRSGAFSIKQQPLVTVNHSNNINNNNNVMKTYLETDL